MKRAERRQHYYRIKRNRRYYYGNTEQDIIKHDLSCNIQINHCPDCSCVSCGNPRRHFSYKTRSELKSTLNYIEQCEETDIHCKVTRNQIKYKDW